MNGIDNATVCYFLTIDGHKIGPRRPDVARYGAYMVPTPSMTTRTAAPFVHEHDLDHEVDKG